MTDQDPRKTFRLRSFVRRDGRRTVAQERAHEMYWPQFGLDVANGLLDMTTLFKRDAKRFLEIGFGSGQSLIEAARLHPDCDFIGIETHKPGIGALCLGIETHALTNVRIYYADAIDVLEKCIPNQSLDGISIFFPDPWQKRKHHARRLIQIPLLKMLVDKLKPAGELHLATDWDDYATHMMRVLESEPRIQNKAGEHAFSERSWRRPIVTKFERRAIREGRTIHELQWQKIHVVK